MKLIGTSANPIGVDIGRACIRAAQVDAAGSVRTCATRRNDHSVITARDVQATRDLLARGAFVGDRVILSVTGLDVTTARIELPPADSGAPFDRLALQAVAELSGKPPGELEHAWWVLPAPARGGSGQNAMVTAVPQRSTAEMIAMFARAGIEVSAIDVRMLSVTRSATPEWTIGSGLDVLVDLGWSAARIIVCCEGVPVYERISADAGVDTAETRVATELSVDVPVAAAVLRGAFTDATSAAVREQAVARLVNDTLDAVGTAVKYAKHLYSDREVASYRIVGGGTVMPGFGDGVAARLDGRDAEVIRGAGSGTPEGYEQAAGLSRWGVAA